MKLKLKNYSWLLFAGLIACKGIEPMKLSPSNNVVYKPSNKTGILMKDTVVMDFSEGTGGWHTWMPGNYQFYSYNRNMLIDCNEAGGDSYPSINIKLPKSNFSQGSVFKVRMKAEGSTNPAAVRLDFVDDKGIVANASAMTKWVAITDTFVDYTFDYTHAWSQGWPEAADVDVKNVEGIQLFVNPGMKETWTGRLVIDEVRVESPKTDDIIIDQFDGMTNLWWPCKKEKVSLGRDPKGTNSLKVHIEDGQWDCFGKVFAPVDVSDHPIIRVKARAERADGTTGFTNVMARFIDVKEASTDLMDGDNMRPMAIGGSDFVDYYSVFIEDGDTALYSSMGEFDKTQVNRLIVFINMNKEANFTGDVYIDEIAFMKKLPAADGKKIEQQGTFGEPPTPEKSWKEGSTKPAVIINSIDNKSKKFVATKNGSGLSMKCTKAGLEWDLVEASIEPTNLYSKGYFKVVAKATGGDANLRIDIVDNRGIIGNSRPIEKLIKNGEYQTYYYSMDINYYQRFPKMDIVNAKSIEKLQFYVNGGMENTFTGSIDIKSIEIVDIQEATKDQ